MLKKLNYKIKFFTIFFILLANISFSYWDYEWDQNTSKEEYKYSLQHFDEILSKETSILKLNVLLLIRLYQKTLSGKTHTECNFFPSCSKYSFYAIEKYGTIKGILMMIDRIIRCNPWAYTNRYPIDYKHHKFYDPVEYNSIGDFIFEFLNF